MRRNDPAAAADAHEGKDDDMKVLGITGGVGSGKSRVLGYLEETYGAVICQMDDVARKLQQRGTRCFRRIVDMFGPGILGAGGEIDRAALGAIVFSNEERLHELNGIVHPEVIRAVRQRIRESEESGSPLFVVEAALLPDVGRELCDELWYIYADERIRRQRLRASRGYTDEKITQMIASQPGEEQFRAACAVVIDNSGDFEDTMRQIGEHLKR